MTSRKPRVVTIAMRGNSRPIWPSSALVAIVVERPRKSTAEASHRHASSAASKAASTPRSGSRGVLGIFNERTLPVSESSAATSVNVPPTSMPTRNISSIGADAGQLVLPLHLDVLCVDRVRVSVGRCDGRFSGRVVGERHRIDA